MSRLTKEQRKNVELAMIEAMLPITDLELGSRYGTQFTSARDLGNAYLARLDQALCGFVIAHLAIELDELAAAYIANRDAKQELQANLAANW